MRKRLKRLRCRVTGHGKRQLVRGTVEGQLLMAVICDRCHYVFESSYGSRQSRRRMARPR